ncbi:MAG: CUAEP/CCAEP-tail radical SAM protein [Chloroflexi bacterium]|nr:CUAEP/CCAEP-tail radical SAM protein [Chloroflexota bacterium]
MPDSTQASARTQGARVLLLSTYEMGHQPVGLAAPAAALRARGHHVDVIDLGVDPLDEARVGVADLIALSIPMHTPARLAQQLIPRLRALRPDVPIALYGLYAGLLGDLRTSGVVDAVAGGEYEPALCDLADRVAAGDGIDGFDAPDAAFVRQDYPVPDRTGLPALDRYAQLQTEHGFSVAGYVEATRGCAHQCLHCPVTAAYDGRLRLVAPEVVLADIDQQVAAGAAHITFGDPDFLNAVPHSLAIAEGLHERHPELSFDFTAKVEHLLEQADLLPRLRELGCLFVTSAFEATSDEVLRQLDKGHTAADLVPAIEACDAAGLALRPTWMTFTPWTTAEDLADMLAFIEAHGLVERVPPVQYGLRLLLPPGSPLIAPTHAQGLLGDYDAEALTYEWRPLDERIDPLQRAIADLVAEQHADIHAGHARTFGLIRDMVIEATGQLAPATAAPRRVLPATPGLTESWFC